MSDSIIYHVDVNSAFLSWTAKKLRIEHPASQDILKIPSVIGGDEQSRHGIVLAKSSPAKKYGIQTGEPLSRAREKCPNLQIYQPDFEYYVECSNRFIELLRSVAPQVEQYSIDEAFCDMSGTQKLYGDPVVFANTLRERIYKELGFTVNIGVSSNKLLAKMASEFEKPNRTHTLFENEIAQKMWPLPVEELFFVGTATATKLHSIGLNTIGELAACDPVLLSAHFKKQGELLHRYANGKDISLKSRYHSAKGYSNEVTLHEDITDETAARTILLSLSETLGARIRADKAYVSVISVNLTTSDFRHFSHQKSLYSSTNVTEEIYRTACELFHEMWKQEPVRLIGIGTSKVSDTSTYQYNLFDQDKFERLTKLNSAIDTIRNRYGDTSITRACFIDKPDGHIIKGMSQAKQNARKKQSVDD